MPNSRFCPAASRLRGTDSWLPAVVEEAELIAELAHVLMDDTFLKDDLENTFLRNDYRYVHIASHGQFSVRRQHVRVDL